MADLSYSVDVNTGPAQRNLDQLNKRVEKLNTTFSGLRGAIAGLAIGTMITNVVRLADSIQDVSDATGVAVQNILGFQQAVQLNGGTADQAQSSLQKLVQTIGEAASGSKSAQSSFAEVGISLQDLATLSEQDLLSKTIQGLAKIDDAGKRAVLTTDLLGKGFRGINVQGVASQLNSATIASGNYAKSIQQTADMQNKLDIATQKLQLSLLKAIQPMVEFINKMDDDKIGKMIDSIVSLATSLAALAASIYIIEKLGRGFLYLAGAIGTAYAAFKIGVGGMILGLASLGKTAQITLKVLTAYAAPAWIAAIKNGSGLVTQMGITFATLGKRLAFAGVGFATVAGSLLRMIPYVGQLVAAVYLLNEALDILTGKNLRGWFDEAAAGLERFVTEKFPKLAAAINKLNNMLGMGPPPSVSQAAQAEHDNEMQRLKNRQQMAIDSNKKESNAVREVTDALAAKRKEIQQAAQAYKDQNTQILDSINFEKSLIGKSEDLQEVMRAQEDVFKRAAAESEKLRDAKSKLGKDEQGLAITYDQQIAKIQEIAEKDAQRIGNAITGLQGVKMLEEDRLRTMQNVTAAIEAQISRQQQLGDLMISANDKLKETQFAGAQQQRSPLEQQLAAIQEEARKAALEAGRVFAASYDGMDLTSAQSEELAAGLQQIADKYKLIAQEQTNNLNASRTWEQGWKTAFDNYMDNATNAAQQAGQVFSSITRNMESAIDNFVQTGKFSFKDFSRSIIQDMIKIELKAQATKLLGAIGGSGGILSSIGSLFGFANGGTPPLNKPSIVGEQGPELFVPRSAGTIIPNDRLGGGGAGMISAPVTNNYITNNISAVDAKSVAQLFAENRKTLLGTVEMARKELPYSNR
jgi:lambda family phage tail tape measure protein